MTSYRRTIQRHKLVLSLPIIIVVLLALWTTAGTPKTYEASASLWVDNLPPAESSLAINDISIRPPAEIQQILVSELLQTHDFRLRVGRTSPLGRYLASNPSKGWGPMGLLHNLSSPGSLDSQIAGALAAGRVTTFVAGPQVLQVSYQAGTPEVAAGTLQALITELDKTQSRFAEERSKATSEYNRTQVDAANRALQDARTQLGDYEREHPGAGSSDPRFVALQRTVRTATRDLARLTTQLNQGSIVQADPTSGVRTASAGFTVMDAPKPPTGPVSGKKKLVMALFGGLFAGALLSFLALIALTPSRPPEPHLRPVESPAGPLPAAGLEREQQAGAAKTTLRRVPPAPRSGSGSWADS
jgi:uncharacterized protein involved in exopolysaccharide biosynthesis